MRPETEDEKFLSLYLEQTLSDPNAVDALIHGGTAATVIARELMERVGASELEQQSLLCDMFRVVSKEGEGAIVDNADAVATLFSDQALEKIFIAHHERLLQLYLESIKRITQDNSVYESIDKLLEIGEIISPFISKKGEVSQIIINAWHTIRNQRRDPDERLYILDKIEVIREALSRAPRRKRTESNGLPAPTEAYADRELDNATIQKEILAHPKMGYWELARLLHIHKGRVYYNARILRRPENDEQRIEKRRAGRPTSPIRGEEILETVRNHPDMSYKDIATNLLKIEPSTLYAALHRFKKSKP